MIRNVLGSLECNVIVASVNYSGVVLLCTFIL